MGKRGPLPGPKRLRVLTGDISIQAGSDAPSLRVDFDPPDAPVDFDDEHLAVWNKTIDLLRLSSPLKKTDGSILEAYCTAVIRWRKAEKEMKDDSLVVFTEKGQSANPLIKIARDERAQMVAFAVHLGMTPSARAKISAAQGEDLNKRVNAFLKIKKAKNERVDEQGNQLRKVIDGKD